VLLNTTIWPNMTCELADKKSLRISAQDTDLAVKVFLIMVSSLYACMPVSPLCQIGVVVCILFYGPEGQGIPCFTILAAPLFPFFFALWSLIKLKIPNCCHMNLVQRQPTMKFSGALNSKT